MPLRMRGRTGSLSGDKYHFCYYLGRSSPDPRRKQNDETLAHSAGKSLGKTHEIVISTGNRIFGGCER